MVIHSCIKLPLLAALAVASIVHAGDPFLDEVRAKIPVVFRGMEGDFHRERMDMKLEAAERLAALPHDTLILQAELEEFRNYFRRAFELWERDPLNPAVKPAEIDVRDFGVKGDGQTDDAPAFTRAVDAVRRLGGRPCVLRIPAGTFLLGTAKKSISGPVAQLDLSCLTNCAVTGNSPETTRFEFGVYNATGVVLDRSENTTLARADFSWREAPFSQTVLESYEPSNCTAIVRHHPGTLKPDDPRYRRASHAQVCGLFTADGKALHDRGATSFFDLRADDLGGGRYRIYFDTKNRPGMAKFRPRPGDVVVLPDRDNAISGISTRSSWFCNLNQVWFRNARASTISGAGAHYVTADHCRTFPKSPDLVFSSNADTFYNARGSHLAHCEFWGMNDDGANSLGNGTGILSRDGARTVVIYPRKGGRVRVGDVLQILHPMEGRFAGDFRIASIRAFKAKNGGERWAITFDSDLPADLVTCAESGQIDNATRYALSHGLGQVKKAPDLLFFPLEYGTGFTMLDNRIHDLRGCGLNVQCPHTIIDGNVFENISLGMKITALTQWYEGTPPCNVLVRNNVFRNCRVGIASHFTTINARNSKERPIRWLEIVSNRMERVSRPFALNNVSDETIRDNEIVNGQVGAVGSRQCPVTLKKALIAPRLDAKVLARLKDNGYDGVELSDRSVTVEEARAARALAEANGLRIHSFMGGWFMLNSSKHYAEAMDLARHSLRLASAYGADVMLFVPYCVTKKDILIPSPTEYFPEFDPETLRMTRCVKGDNARYVDYIAEQNNVTECAKRAVRELIPLATELGVTIAIENVGGYWLWAKPEFLRALVKHFRSPYVKAYIDLGNNVMFCPSEQWIDAMPDEVVRLHVKDHEALPGGTKKDAPLGLGSIDFHAIRESIERNGYSGWVSVETSKRSDAEHAAFMDDFFRGDVPARGYLFGRK